MAFQTPVTIGTVLDRIHKRDYVLPAIQREFVWKPDQITRLFDSLMLGYPIGSFLFWKVSREQSTEYVFYEFMTDYHERTGRHLDRLDLGSGRDVTGILDGQQRLTSLNIGLRGSHAEKLHRMWVTSPSAYPVRHLYLNITEPEPENELGMEYEFRFLTKERLQAAQDSEKHWFPVTDILSFDDLPEIHDYILDAGMATNRFAFKTLSRLHSMVNKDLLINFYEEESQDLDKVLNIFIRVNSGGTTLSYSDLLLSIAIAQWSKLDAREVIHELVDDLNETGQGFTFSKDLVLKAGLLLCDLPSVAFRVTNFNSANMALLETQWIRVADALRRAVRLLSDFGLSGRTLTADSVILPIAYYLFSRNVGDNYLTATSMQLDREAIRTWVIRSLLKSGIWGSGLDTMLLALRSEIRENGAHGFPIEHVDAAMARLGKATRFEAAEIEELLSLRYGDRQTFVLLSLLYPGMDFRNTFHIDHIFPRDLFRKSALKKAGFPDDLLDSLIADCNMIPNLQLLEGPLNNEKRAKPPHTWMADYFPDHSAREIYGVRHDLGTLPEAVSDFPAFFVGRRDRMRTKLGILLDMNQALDNAPDELIT